MIIRPMRLEDVTGIARVHARTWQTTYRGILPDDYLYESLGGQFVKTNTLEVGGISVNECAYAWTDLSPLVQDERA